MNQTKQYDVIVLGAGAAGLMCALTAGQNGLKVLVLEKSNKPGKKILMSGGGRCNFTNIHTTAENFISANPHFCKSALSQYTPWHFIEMVNKHQIPYHEKELGQLFCDRSSKDILNMLLDECAAGQVEIRMQIEQLDIQFGPIIQVNTSGDVFMTKNLVVATGGLSIPKMGGSDYGYQLAKQLDLDVLPKQAALVPFVFTDSYKDLFVSISGVAIAVEVSLPETKTAPKFRHQMLFTHRGLSGPAILQISSYWQTGQNIAIDLLPGINGLEELIRAKQDHPQQLLSHWLGNLLTKKAALAILSHEFPALAEKSLHDLSNEKIKTIASRLNAWELKPSGTEGYRTAEVTLGGVDTKLLSSKTMACKNQANTFFIGEVVDVTGHLGGFNFQWAWASGYAAAMALTN
ncbi:MAG: NAD(P)/FAD-dependent oxidoreductase [Marinicella sp.]